MRTEPRTAILTAGVNPPTSYPELTTADRNRNTFSFHHFFPTAISHCVIEFIMGAAVLLHTKDVYALAGK